MKTQYKPAPAEILAQIGKDEKITHEFCFSHGVCNSSGELLHYCAMVWPERYICTLEQKETAAAEYNRMKAEKLAQIGNKLVFVGMGMAYQPKYEGDPGNHRIRTEIINPEGRRFFVEFGTGRGENMRIDHVVDRDQQREYEEKAAEYLQKIQDAGGFHKVGKGHYLYKQHEKFMSQPYYWYKRKDWESLSVKYTESNILKLVNSLFDCNFQQMEVSNYLLNTEEYFSFSPKN